MNLRDQYTHFWLAILTHVAVAEWFRASDDFRPFGQKLKWGPGGKIFFQKTIFDLSLILIFTLFFKPCVTFLLIYVAIFHKMAPLFSYEPTVSLLFQKETVKLLKNL